jgi:hypothetical protein
LRCSKETPLQRSMVSAGLCSRIRPTPGETTMTRNMSAIDRLVRFYAGLALVAFALPFWAPQTGWNWIGWFGLIPMLSAIVGTCGIYRLVGMSTAIGR